MGDSLLARGRWTALRGFRKATGLSLRALARGLGVSTEKVHRIESGELKLGKDEDLLVRYQKVFRRLGVEIRKREVLQLQRERRWVLTRPEVPREFGFHGGVRLELGVDRGACFDDPRDRDKDWSLGREVES